MPNHVRNELHMEGSLADVAKVEKAIEGMDDNGDIVCIDFNKIIPQPKELDDVEE